jgi:hypothetical protein
MLISQGVIASADGEEILKGLDAIEGEIAAGAFPFRDEYEDIHMNIEARLRELIGPTAGRLHTARSRNDQVAVDFRLWVRDACDRSAAQLEALQRALLAKAEAHADALMPGFTHLQPAQPVTFGHHLMAYVEMFGRDASRFRDARTRMNECPLGAAALAGSPFPIDRHADGRGPGLRPADRQFAGQRLGPRLRPGSPVGRLDHRHAPVAPGRGDRAVDDADVRLHQADRRLHHRQLDHAAEEEPGRRRADPRQGRPHPGLASPP